MKKMPNILVVDDEASIRESLKDWLMEDGYSVALAIDGEDAILRVEASQYDVILLDLKMPGIDGLETMRRIKEISPDSEVLMMTAYAAVDTAVLAMKEGAFDYLVKPFDPDEIELQIKKILAHKEVILENILLRKRLEEQTQYDEIIGKSPAMQEIFDLIDRVAPSDSTVLITGESGTGKELVAKAIHGNSSRCYMPFVAVNCGALPDSLLESELFGYEKGAFTGADHTKRGRFEMAQSGTILLDEIGDISLKTQVDLLRVLQQKEISPLGSESPIEVDVRILAATNRDLDASIKKGDFREDLFYRLNVISIHMPPLRERKEDIPLLANAFVKQQCMKMNREIVKISLPALRQLMDYHWPGNVRELENIIERALVIGAGKEILTDDLPFSRTDARVSDSPKSLKMMERAHILRILEQTEWNISKAAREMDIDRQTLYNKMNKYAIKRGES